MTNDDAVALLRKAWAAGLALRPTAQGTLRIRYLSSLPEELFAELRAHREELIALLRQGCPACGAPVVGEHPCLACGGHRGHTISCLRGAGPADGPSVDDVFAVAAGLEFPRLRVKVPASPPFVIPGSLAGWRGFLRSAAERPEVLRAAFEALEAFERRWRTRAPTAAEVAT